LNKLLIQELLFFLPEAKLLVNAQVHDF